MAEKRRRNFTASLGLTAALFTGGCGGTNVHTTGAVSEHATEEEQARAKLLRSLYEEVYSSILQYSPQALATILEPMKHGIKVKRVGSDGNSCVYIKGKETSEDYLEKSLALNLTTLLGDLGDMQERRIQPPSQREIRDTFVAAIYAALKDEKYKGLALEGFNMQDYLGSKLFGAWIEGKISRNVGEIIERDIPEIALALETAKAYPQGLATNTSLSTNIGR